MQEQLDKVRALLADKWVILYRGLYWGPNRGGYTNNLLMAGLYSEEEATQFDGYDRGDKGVPALGEFEQIRDSFTRQDTLIAALLAQRALVTQR